MTRGVLVLALLGALWSGPVAAQTSIVAVVNGDPITTSEVAQRQALLRISGTSGNLREIALNELIDERVQFLAASQARIAVSDAEVDAAVGDIATRVKLSPAQLKQALAGSGVNIETLRARLRTQIAFQRLVRTRFQSRAVVTEQDLVAALLKDETRERQIEATEYLLEQVMIALPEKPSAQRVADAKSRAEDVRRRFEGCAEGLEMARNTRNVVVKPFGRRMDMELAPAAQAAVKDVPVGKLSAPVETARGLVMFAVCDKKTFKSTNAAMKALEPELTEAKGDAFFKQYTRQLRRDATIERR